MDDFSPCGADAVKDGTRDVEKILMTDPVGPNGFLPAPPKSTLRNDTREFSRLKSGEVSFGPVGRLVMSVIVGLPVLFIWFMMGGPYLKFDSFFAVFMTIVIVPAAVLPMMALRDIWRAHRVR